MRVLVRTLQRHKRNIIGRMRDWNVPLLCGPPNRIRDPDGIEVNCTRLALLVRSATAACSRLFIGTSSLRRLMSHGSDFPHQLSLGMPQQLSTRSLSWSTDQQRFVSSTGQLAWNWLVLLRPSLEALHHLRTRAEARRVGLARRPGKHKSGWARGLFTAARTSGGLESCCSPCRRFHCHHNDNSASSCGGTCARSCDNSDGGTCAPGRAALGVSPVLTIRVQATSGSDGRDWNARPAQQATGLQMARRRHSSSSAHELAVHPSAVVSPSASIGCGVSIGPYCFVGPHVQLEERVKLHSHVVLSGHTHVGSDTTIFPFATLGAKPQDLKYAGERSELRIGRRCRVFEYAHLSGGTAGGGGVTTIGDDCMLMSHTHVGHDCRLGDRVLLASNSSLAGHVTVGDGAQVSGHSCVHQRVSIGNGAFLAAASVLVSDLVPFGLAIGNRARLETLNMRGLRRQRASPAEQRALLRAFRYVFELPASDRYYAPLDLPRSKCLEERARQVHLPQFPRVMEMVAFILGQRGRSATRPLCRPGRTSMQFDT